jgi:hypothetical protein
MATYVVRIWIPDRPGALGAVASRIGSVRGDLIGIDILERGAGMAIDELVVTLPDEDLVPLLIKEIGEVDGVAVEDVAPVPGDGGLPDPRLAALETASVLVQQGSADGVLGALAERAGGDFSAEWVAVVDRRAPRLCASFGSPPAPAWIAAFVTGAASAPAAGPADMAWAHLPRSDLDLVVGRPGRPVRGRERQQLAALAEIAAGRWAELGQRAQTGTG